METLKYMSEKAKKERYLDFVEKKDVARELVLQGKHSGCKYMNPIIFMFELDGDKNVIKTHNDEMKKFGLILRKMKNTDLCLTLATPYITTKVCPITNTIIMESNYSKKFKNYEIVPKKKGSTLKKRNKLYNNYKYSLKKQKQRCGEKGDYRCYFCYEHRENLKVCTGCKSTKYCSKKCQMLDWEIHKIQCSKIKKRKCNHCNITGAGFKKCSKCESKWYCGKTCQTLDWVGGHENECKKI